jgi:hypothetical protein
MTLDRYKARWVI